MSLIDLIVALFGRHRPIPPVVPPPQPPPPPVVLPGPPVVVPGPSVSDIPAQLLAAHNAERARHGLAPLRANAALMATARDHSAWMAAHRQMTHMGADGDPWARMAQHGYRFSSASENVAWDERDVPEVMGAWMSSSGHAANILGDYVDFGGAMAQSADGARWWTANFGRSA